MVFPTMLSLEARAHSRQARNAQRRGRQTIR